MSSYATRLSNIEILRLVCILLIVGAHVSGAYWKDLLFLEREIVLLYNSFSGMAVTLFVLISGYFGITFKKSKLFTLVNIVWFYSVVLCLFKISITGFNSQETLRSFFPVLSCKYWFATCYVIIFVLSPFINKLLGNLTKSQFRWLIIILAFFFVIAPTFIYFEILGDKGKGLPNMILAYCIGRYLAIYGFPRYFKLYPKRIFFACIFGTFLLNSLITEWRGTMSLPFCRDNSLFILVQSVACLCLFLRYNFVSAKINYLSQFVFPLYISSQSLQFLVDQKRYLVFDNTLLSVLCNFVAIVIVCVLLELIRRAVLGKSFKAVERKELSVVDGIIRHISVLKLKE